MYLFQQKKLEMSKKTKVLILHNYMAPYRFPLFREISHKKDLDLTVYFMSKSAKNRKWKSLPKLGFKYKVLPKLELSYTGKDFFAFIINYSFPFEFLVNKFDVVVSAGWLDFASHAAFILSKLMRKKFILWSESTINEPSWRRTITLPWVKFMVGNADAYIAIGTLSKDYLVSLGADPRKIKIAYSTVDVDFFMSKSRSFTDSKIELKKKFNIKNKFVILFVGQFIERKGLIYLIKAFEMLINKLNNCTLVMLGYGPEEESLKKYITVNEIKNVKFVGHVDVNDIPEIYAIADVFVLPSLEETWGLVINEAMASALPVIATRRVGSAGDLIKDGKNGYVIPEKNYKELESKLFKILSNDLVRKNMSKESSKIIKNFTPVQASDSFREAIKLSQSIK